MSVTSSMTMGPPSIVEHDSARMLAMKLAKLDFAMESDGGRKRQGHVVVVAWGLP